MRKFFFKNTITKFFYTQNLWNRRIKILDIGLDNESISKARLVYKNIEIYHGLDIRDLSEAEKTAIDQFYLLDLDSGYQLNAGHSEPQGFQGLTT